MLDKFTLQVYNLVYTKFTWQGKVMTLQKIRKFTLIISMMLFPITIYYFSPYLIIMAAMQHIINGSFIVFSMMFILGLFFGRLWCGFLCPTGGMCECFAQISDKTPKQGWHNYIKYGIWLVWLSFCRRERLNHQNAFCAGNV